MDNAVMMMNLRQWLMPPEFCCASLEIQEKLSKWLDSQLTVVHDNNTILCNELLEHVRCLWLCRLVTTPALVAHLTSRDRLQTFDYEERVFRVNAYFIPYLLEAMNYAHAMSPNMVMDLPAKARHLYLSHVGLPLPTIRAPYLPQRRERQ